MFAACLDHGNLMNKKLPSDILNHIFTLMSGSFAEQDAWIPIYLISFGGSGSNVMPSPKDSGCSGWNDPVGKIGTWHIKKKKKKMSHSYHMDEDVWFVYPWIGSHADQIKKKNNNSAVIYFIHAHFLKTTKLCTQGRISISMQSLPYWITTNGPTWHCKAEVFGCNLWSSEGEFMCCLNII